MRKIAWFALAASLSTAAPPVAAVPVAGLYEAAVPVADQNTRLRDPALREALGIVMVRVTGQRDFSSGPGGPLLDRTNTFLQGYGYESVPNGLQLRARFDARAVDRELRALGLPVWGINRISHQIWIALRDGGSPDTLLDQAGATTRAATLLAAADQRGIPLVFPAMDATDRKLANFRSVWNGDFGGIRGAAARYTPDLVVVVRAGREAGAWLSRWTVLKDDGSEEQWSRLQPTLEQSLAEGMHELADRQARRFAVQTGTQQDIAVVVSGVRSVDDYGRVLNYLRKLNPVRAAFVEQVAGGDVHFRLQVEGEPQLLPRVIAAGSVLRAQDDSSLRELRYSLAR